MPTLTTPTTPNDLASATQSETDREPGRYSVNEHTSELGGDLLSLLLAPDQPWQVHNCKVTERTCHQDGTLPFLYHYDQLSDEQKQLYPLTPALLSQFNQAMTADDAKQLLADTHHIDGDVDSILSIADPWYVRVAGSAVLYQPALLLAVRLHWQSSTQQLQPIYCQEPETAIKLAIDGWSLYGRVDVLYQGKLPLFCHMSVDTSLSTTAGDANTINHPIPNPIPSTGTYQLLPTNLAISLLTELNENLNALQVLDTQIKARVL